MRSTPKETFQRCYEITIYERYKIAPHNNKSATNEFIRFTSVCSKHGRKTWINVRITRSITKRQTKRQCISNGVSGIKEIGSITQFVTFQRRIRRWDERRSEKGRIYRPSHRAEKGPRPRQRRTSSATTTRTAEVTK